MVKKKGTGAVAEATCVSSSIDKEETVLEAETGKPKIVVEDVKPSEEVPEQDNGFDNRLVATLKGNKFSFEYIKTFKISDAIRLLDACRKNLQMHQQRGTFDRVNGMKEVV